jgi:hypothetical protein
MTNLIKTWIIFTGASIYCDVSTNWANIGTFTSNDVARTQYVVQEGRLSTNYYAQVGYDGKVYELPLRQDAGPAVGERRERVAIHEYPHIIWTNYFPTNIYYLPTNIWIISNQAVSIQLSTTNTTQ